MEGLPAGMEGLPPGMMNLEDLGAGDGEFDSPPAYEVGVEAEVPGAGGKLRKTLLAAGQGFEHPEAGDEVFVHYTGRLEDGTVFDSSVDRGQEFSFKVGEGRVIKGWDEGIPTMLKGEKCILTCSPEYAYGAQGSPPKIPGGATLAFEVELLRWTSTSDVCGDGGLVRKVLAPGEGWGTPGEQDEVLFRYSLRVRGGAEVVVPSLAPGGGDEAGAEAGGWNARFEPFERGCELPAFHLGLQGMKRGGECHLTIQPKYGFGPEAAAELGVPADAVLEATLKLVQINKVENLEGGLVKKILFEPEGWKRPNEGSTVRVRYTARLAEGGTVFEERASGDELEFVTGEAQVIEGLEEAVMSMQEGERCRLTVPPAMAFGADGRDFGGARVPPEATVVYDLELVSFVKAREVYEMDHAEKVEACAARKAEGNALFKQGNLVRAAKKYSAGAKFVEADTDFSAAQQQEARKLKIACWNNAAQCQLKLGDYAAARALCGKVLDLDGLNMKALFRRGQAHTGLQDFVEAGEDLKAALGQEPDNADVKRARKRLAQLQSAYDKKQAKAYKNMFSRISKMEEEESRRAQPRAAADAPSTDGGEATLTEA